MIPPRTSKMQIMTNLDENKYGRARKRVEQIKGFYVHLTVYLVVNAAILIALYFVTADKGNFWKPGHFSTPFFWGIGVAFHAIKTFRINPLFGKKWEERQIRKYMEEDRRESDKRR